MKRETFFAPDPSHPDRYLKLRGRRWHYVRRVPKSIAAWDARGTIQLSLRTASLEVARLKRDELEKADDLYWSGVTDGWIPGQLKRRIEQPRRARSASGFTISPQTRSLRRFRSMTSSRGLKEFAKPQAVRRPPFSARTKSRR